MGSSESELKPEFVRGSPLLEDAYATAYEGHQRRRKPGGDEIGHPVAVAELLHRHRFGDEVVAAALLHDVVEDTSIDLREISSRFGPEICTLVDEMTEDESLEPYATRKAEHRARVSRDRLAAAIYAADKLARTRDFNAHDERPEEKRMDHYMRTLETLRAAQPDLPFLGELQTELQRLSEPPRTI